MTSPIRPPKQGPLDPIVEQLVTRLAAEITKLGAEIDPQLDDLAAVGLWARVDALTRDHHLAAGRAARDRGRSWDDLARATGLSSASSAESRYSGRGPKRAAETRARAARGETVQPGRPRKSVLVDGADWLGETPT